MLERQKEHLKHVRTTSINKFEAFVGEALYVVFFILYNLFELYLVYLMAKYNDRVIEMCSILTCFFINKSLLGKPLHFISSLICFIVSLTTFYILTRCAISVSISIFANVILGVGTGFITSYLATYVFKPKYKRNLVEELIALNLDDEQVLAVCRRTGLDEEIGHIVNFRITNNEDLTCYEFSIDRSTLNRKLNKFLKRARN